jgi:hypothetical protein
MAKDFVEEKKKDHPRDRVLVERIPSGKQFEYWREIADRFVAKKQAKIIKLVSRYKSPEEIEAEEKAAKEKTIENKKEQKAPTGGRRPGNILD